MPLQDTIHKLELGSGQVVVKLLATTLGFVLLAVWYDVQVFRGISTPEGLDAAQVARNLREGNGYSTQFIRPFSIHLLQSHALGPPTSSAVTNDTADGGLRGPNPKDPGHVYGHHPDLANAPAYPALLAGILMIMPFRYPDLLAAKSFSVYWPDLWIVGFNQLLFLCTLVLVFRLARSLFDETAGWLAVVSVGVTELFWHFTGAGHSTPFLMLVMVGLLSVLAALDRAARNPESPARRLTWLAIFAGLLLGVAGLTRYSFALLVVPVIVWLVALPSPRKAGLAVITALVFLVVFGPWLVRNYSLSETLFGSAGFASLQGTYQFPANELERSLNPNLSTFEVGMIMQKLVSNLRELVASDLADFGGSWISVLFLVGLLIPFRNPTLGRTRLLLLSFVFTLAIAQALGRTWLSQDKIATSSENLLAVLGPVIFIFSVAFFLTLIDSFAIPAFRYMALGVFLVLASLPLLLTLFRTHGFGNYPPAVQARAAQLNTDQWMMTDIPWATAWYGQRASVWLSLEHRADPDRKFKNDFFATHSLKPVSGLYLAGPALEAVKLADIAQWRRDESERKGEDWDRLLQLAAGILKQFSDPAQQPNAEALRQLLQLVDRHWPNGQERDWAGFLLGIYISREVPTGFPLRRAPLGLETTGSVEVFLTDSERKSPAAIKSSE